MKTRRLLILCYFFPPLAGGGVHRVLGFARHLPRYGWTCTVVCAGPEDYWVQDESLVAEIPAGIEVIRVAGGSGLSAWLKLNRSRGRRPSGTFAAFRRMSDWCLIPDSYVGWAGRARVAAARVLRRGDIAVLLSTSPPDSLHLAALALKKRFGVPWLADFRDPWIGLHFRTPPMRWHRARHAELERRVIENADTLVVASRTHAEAIAAQFGTRAHAIHVPNGYEPAAANERGDASSDAGDGSHFLLAYTGVLSLMPDVEVLLEALHDLFAATNEARRRVRARLAGPFDSGYADRAVSLGLTGIADFSGPLAHGAARALQRRADVLLLWKPRNCPAMVPGKLYEYLDSGRPVLALLDSDDEAADLVRRAGGEVVKPGSRSELMQAIERRYRSWKETGRVPSQRPPWLEEHTRERLAERLASLLDASARGAVGGLA